MTFSKKASVFVHSCSFRTFIHWKDMKIVLKQSDFSDPAILVQRNQQLKLHNMNLTGIEDHLQS